MAKHTLETLPYSPLHSCAAWLNEVERERMEQEKTKDEMERDEMDHMKSRESTPESLPFEDWYAIMKKYPDSHDDFSDGGFSAPSVAGDCHDAKQSPDSPDNSSIASSSRGSSASSIAGDYFKEKQSPDSPDNSSLASSGSCSNSSVAGDFNIDKQPLVIPSNSLPTQAVGVYYTEKQSPDSPDNSSIASSGRSSASSVAGDFHVRKGQPQDSPPSSPLASYPASHTEEPSSSNSPTQATCHSPTTPILSTPVHQGQQPSAFEEKNYLVSRQEHRRLCSELFTRIASWEEMLENGEANE
jgi:hypothetical protein